MRAEPTIVLVLLSASDSLGLRVNNAPIGRRAVIQEGHSVIAAAAGAAAATSIYREAASASSLVEMGNGVGKKRNISPEELAAIVKADLEERQFLVTGQLTREIYAEEALFTDEIDTYTLEKWMKGTAKLFVAELSHVDLVGPIVADANEVSFRFSETLAFNLPFLKPKVPLTGRLVLKRGPDGLITSYREFWDQGTFEVLSKAYL